MPEQRHPQKWSQLSQSDPFSGVKLHRKFVPNCAADLRNVSLVGAKLIFRRGTPPARNTLVQDAAYSNPLPDCAKAGELTTRRKRHASLRCTCNSHLSVSC